MGSLNIQLFVMKDIGVPMYISSGICSMMLVLAQLHWYLLDYTDICSITLVFVKLHCYSFSYTGNLIPEK